MYYSINIAVLWFVSQMVETIFCNFSCLVGQIKCPVSIENNFMKNSRVEVFIYQSLSELENTRRNLLDSENYLKATVSTSYFLARWNSFLSLGKNVIIQKQTPIHFTWEFLPAGVTWISKDFILSPHLSCCLKMQ